MGEGWQKSVIVSASCVVNENTITLRYVHIVGENCETSTNEASSMNNLKVIRTKDLLKQLNISRISLWRWSKEGKFPQPLRVNGRAFGYRVQDVESWLDGQKK